MRTKSLILSVVVFGLTLVTPAIAATQVRDADLAEQVAVCVRQYVSFSIFDDINVAVSDRAVTLTGRVTMPFKRDDIGKRVAKIDGVRSLVNNIEVLPASRIDADLRSRIANAIYSHPAFWPYASMINPPIHIVVERGRVTLTGCVNNQVERTLAYALAQVDGVLGVINQLRIDKN